MSQKITQAHRLALDTIDRLQDERDRLDQRIFELERQLEAEERDHLQTVEKRDHHEENINQIAAELGLECEWSNLCDVGHECIGAVTYLTQQLEAERAKAADLEARFSAINTPEIHDFIKAVPLEAQHQRGRWGTEHDSGKAPADWFWLIGYLAGKALASHIAGNTEKALHHTISSAAALCNWHSAILGKTNMRPGIDSAALQSQEVNP